jgi:hypothetical protein
MIDKLKQAIEMELATKEGKGDFVLLKKLDDIESKIDNIDFKNNPPETIEVELKIV